MPGLNPARRFSLELGLQGGFVILRLLQSRLVALLLVSQLLGQAVTLLSRGTALSLLGTQRGLVLTQLLPQVGIGLCKDGKRR